MKPPSIPSLKQATYELPITAHEAHALMRLLAVASDSDRVDRADRNIATWLAERIGRKLDPNYFGPDLTERTR